MNIIIMLCVAWVVYSNPTNLNAKSISPYDLEDELREQLEELRSIVNGSIGAAMEEVYEIGQVVYNDRTQAYADAETALFQEHQIFLNQINSIKNLAQASGADIDVCLNITTPAFEGLISDARIRLSNCLVGKFMDWLRIQSDAQYRLQIIINDVDAIEFQLKTCAGAVTCLTSLGQKIELAKIQIPQKVADQLQMASDIHDDLKVQIKQCVADTVALFIMDGGIVVNQVTECANEIMT